MTEYRKNGNTLETPQSVPAAMSQGSQVREQLTWM